MLNNQGSSVCETPLMNTKDQELLELRLILLCVKKHLWQYLLSIFTQFHLDSPSVMEINWIPSFCATINRIFLIIVILDQYKTTLHIPTAHKYPPILIGSWGCLLLFARWTDYNRKKTVLMSWNFKVFNKF